VEKLEIVMEKLEKYGNQIFFTKNTHQKIRNGIHSLPRRAHARENADIILHTGGPKSKPLSHDQKIVLNRIKTC